MLALGTLNQFTGNPSAGKTTLIHQAIAAHERGKLFFVPTLHLPPGSVAYVSTDRSRQVLETQLRMVGSTQCFLISTVDDRSFNAFDHSPELMRQAVTERLKRSGLAFGTLVLDLAMDFMTGSAGNGKLLGHDGRLNVQWAEDLGVAILSLHYPFKQKSLNYALRQQDRTSGAVGIQASASWKFNMIDKAETRTHWILHATPPPLGGPPQIAHMLRLNDPDGVGRFIPCRDPQIHSIEEFMELNGCCRQTAAQYRNEDLKRWLEEADRLADCSSPDWLEKAELDPETVLTGN